MGLSYDPQTSQNFEVGAKTQFFNKRVEFSIAAYNVVTDGFQLSVGPVQGQYLQNVGKVESKGVDLKLKLLATDHLRLTTGVAFNHSRFSDYVNPANPGVNLTGNTLPYAPPVTANLNIEYLIDLPKGAGQLTPHVGVTYVRKTYFNETNTIEQSAYALLDAGISWKANDALTASIFADNITDKVYAVYGFNARPLGDVFQVGRGRLVGGRLIARF